MNVHVFPFGDAGWRGKVSLFREMISSRPLPPHRYDDVLVLVPSSRMRRTYGKLFLDLAEEALGTRALSPPEVRTLHQFLQQLGARTGGRTLIDENSRLVLCESIVKSLAGGNDLFGAEPDLLAPSLAAAAANMIEELARAGATPDLLDAALEQAGLAEKPQAQLLADAFRAYEGALGQKDLVDPPGLLAELTERFDPALLAPYSRIIIDGFHDADLLQAAVLRKIVSAGTGTLLIDAPSADAVRNAGEDHPLRLTREFLARLGLSPGTGQAAASPDDRFLASALFSDTPSAEAAELAPSPFNREITLFSAVNQREEVSQIARSVKASVENCTPADSILVAFPSLDAYGPLVEEIFGDYGIPYNRALGRQLSASPVTTAIVSLLKTVQDDYSGPSLLRVLSSPFLKFAERPDIALSLDRLLRAGGIIGGKDKLLAALRHTDAGQDTGRSQDMLRESLQDLFLALEPFRAGDQAPLGIWMERLTRLVEWSGLTARVSRIRGPLNVNLQAHRKLTETLASLAAAGRLFPEERASFDEWLFLVRKTLMRARFQVPPDDEGGVQVLGLEESAGRAWGEVHLGGLIEGALPQRLPQNIFLPETTLEALGVRTLERARLNAAYHFYRLLQSAPKVFLSWPENAGDRPVVRSPFLEELAPLRTAGLLRESKNIQFSLKVEESRSIPELAKALAVAGPVTGLEALLTWNNRGLSAIRTALACAPSINAPQMPLVAQREFRVTELDDYLACPYDYYMKHVLHIEPLEEPTEDISPQDRGSTVHAILRNFYLAWTRPLTEADRDEAHALLAGLAESAFSSGADTFRNRREKDRFLTVMAVRFLDAETMFWKQSMRPVYLEQKIDSFPIVLADGTEVRITGKIDRIDADENGNFLIVDYKTGYYPLPRMGTGQDIFQLPVYAVMAEQALSGKTPALTRAIGLVYYDLSGKSGGGARDVVLYNKESRDDHPSSKPKSSPKTAEEFAAILQQSMDKARNAIESILKGEFPVRPQDENRCRYCPNQVMCEDDHD